MANKIRGLTSEAFMLGYKTGIEEVERLLNKKIKTAYGYPNQTASVHNYIQGLKSALELVKELKE